MILESRETNKVSPKITPSCCLDRVSRPLYREGESIQTDSLLELKRQCSEYGKSEMVRIHRVDYCVKESNTDRKLQRYEVELS